MKVSKCFLSVLYTIFKCAGLWNERDGELISVKFGNHEGMSISLYYDHRVNHTIVTEILSHPVTVNKSGPF